MAEIARSIGDQILAHAASSTEEVCGLLLAPARHSGRIANSSVPSALAQQATLTLARVGDDIVVADALACSNVHPAPATHFELDPAVLLAAHRAARAGGPSIVGHYHSHPSGRAEPSATDAAHAPPDGALWLVIAGGQITAWHAVRHGALHDRFDPVELVVG